MRLLEHVTIDSNIAGTPALVVHRNLQSNLTLVDSTFCANYLPAFGLKSSFQRYRQPPSFLHGEGLFLFRSSEHVRGFRVVWTLVLVPVMRTIEWTK